jgi:hypothetical protein
MNKYTTLPEQFQNQNRKFKERNKIDNFIMIVFSISIHQTHVEYVQRKCKLNITQM